MAVTVTPRLGLTRWSAGADPFTRAQMDASHAQLESLVAIDTSGALADRPAPGTVGRYYWATDTAMLYRDDGAAWRTVTSFGAATDIAASAPGNTAAAGAVGKPADAGHRHAREAWGGVGDFVTQGFGDAPAAGASGRTADAAHRHGMPPAEMPPHLGASDPHPQYALDTDTAATIAALAGTKEPAWPGATPTLFLASPMTADGTVHPYTVPAGKVAIIRKAEVIPSGNVNGLTVYLADGAGTGWGGVIVVNKALAAGQTIELDGFYVMPAGSLITVTTANNTYGSCWMCVSGLLMNVPVSGPAPILICNNYTASGDNTMYTVPAGKTLVVLTAVATEIGGVATTAALRIGAAPAMLPWQGIIAAGDAIQNDGFWVVPSGNTIVANMGGDAGAHVVFSLSGVLI